MSQRYRPRQLSALVSAVQTGRKISPKQPLGLFGLNVLLGVGSGMSGVGRGSKVSCNYRASVLLRKALGKVTLARPRDTEPFRFLFHRGWRSLKYECVFLSAFEIRSEAPSDIGVWIYYYNRQRPTAGQPRRLCYSANEGATGGVETNPIHLIDQHNGQIIVILHPFLAISTTRGFCR